MPKPETTTDDKVDDFGYETPEEKPAPKAEEPAPKTEEKKAEEPEVKPVTGYEDNAEPAKEAKKEEPKKVEEPAAETEEGKLKVAITEAVKALGDGYNKEGITKFALENKMTAEQVKAYVTFQAAEDQKALEAHETRIKEQRKQWKEELKSDKDFVGEKGDQFDKSVLKVNQLLEKMPNTKKMLTEKGGMLPPYLMKDFLALAKALNPTKKFEGGEPPAPEEKTGNFLDDLYT